MHQTGSEKVNFTLTVPRSPAADRSVGGTVSGGPAVAVWVWGVIGGLPAASRNSKRANWVRVTATSEPGDGTVTRKRLALATPLSPAAVQIGMLSATSKSWLTIPFAITCQPSGLHGVVRQTGLLKVTAATLPPTLTAVNSGGLKLGGGGGASQKMVAMAPE